MKADEYARCREHQALVRANIVAALARLEIGRANMLRATYADLLAIKLPELPLESVELEDKP